jgi:hypothetical protein
MKNDLLLFLAALSLCVGCQSDPMTVVSNESDVVYQAAVTEPDEIYPQREAIHYQRLDPHTVSAVDTVGELNPSARKIVIFRECEELPTPRIDPAHGGLLTIHEDGTMEYAQGALPSGLNVNFDGLGKRSQTCSSATAETVAGDY